MLKLLLKPSVRFHVLCIEHSKVNLCSTWAAVGPAGPMEGSVCLLTHKCRCWSGLCPVWCDSDAERRHWLPAHRFPSLSVPLSLPRYPNRRYAEKEVNWNVKSKQKQKPNQKIQNDNMHISDNRLHNHLKLKAFWHFSLRGHEFVSSSVWFLAELCWMLQI